MVPALGRHIHRRGERGAGLISAHPFSGWSGAGDTVDSGLRVAQHGVLGLGQEPVAGDLAGRILRPLT